MSEHQRSDFPPHWAPPPRVGYGEELPQLKAVFPLLSHESVAPWVAEAYWELGRDAFMDFAEEWRYPSNWREIDHYLSYLENHPQQAQMVHENTRLLKEMLEHLDGTWEGRGPIDQEPAARIRRLLGPQETPLTVEK
jgi:hypothetical protein